MTVKFGEGFDPWGGVLDAAESTGLVSKRGAWYYYGDVKLGQVGGGAGAK